LIHELEHSGRAVDGVGHGHRAIIEVVRGELQMTRDELGVAPLYAGTLPDGTRAGASEVKALLPEARAIAEVPPGHTLRGATLQRYFLLREGEQWTDDPGTIARRLREELEAAVGRRLRSDTMGSWLSGGLDSSALAALARRQLSRLHTFAAGLPGAPDLEFARAVADFIRSDHHEVIVTVEELISLLPVVIEHLESFDALLVRSSLTNYVVAQRASQYVGEVFSGEAGDELFAGYAYLKELDPSALPGELLEITSRLHNTALQRVDRSASAHGTVAHTPFTDPALVSFAFRIPPRWKLCRGIEKWILREAVQGALPDRVVRRTKAKFWEGAGVGDHLARHAAGAVSDSDFARERRLPNGLELNSKEELLYYRIFREHFGELEDFTWMGRTKGAPLEPYE
jgi:asparagine synthase (glutamine-hydrolysing)